jgi:uncharacterized membrane protein
MLDNSQKKHLLKTITWRIFASVVSFLTAWIISGDIQVGLTVGSVDIVLKFVLYYIHERIWYKIELRQNKS